MNNIYDYAVLPGSHEQTWLEKWTMNDDVDLDVSPMKNEIIMFMRGKHLKIVKKEFWTLLSRCILSTSIVFTSAH